MAILKFGTQPFLNPSCKRKRSAAAVVAGFTKSNLQIVTIFGNSNLRAR